MNSHAEETLLCYSTIAKHSCGMEPMDETSIIIENGEETNSTTRNHIQDLEPYMANLSWRPFKGIFDQLLTWAKFLDLQCVSLVSFGKLVIIYNINKIENVMWKIMWPYILASQKELLMDGFCATHV